MGTNETALSDKVALVTGSAKRLGAASIKALHLSGANVLVHYDQSHNAAKALVDELNSARCKSAALVSTKLGTRDQAEQCIQSALAHWNRIDFLINNASSFFPTPLGTIDDSAVTDLFSSNVMAPLFLILASQKELSRREGAVINMVDIHGLRPYKNHSVYCAAKAALVMLTQSMAQELAPHVRVNGIAPGAILWPEDGSMGIEQQRQSVARIPLGRCGTPDEIASLVVYLCSDAAKFITGEIIRVDGGRSI